MNHFPYDGRSNLTPSADPVVSELQKAHSKVEDMLLSMARVDADVKLIAHLDRTPDGHLGQVGTLTGPARYWEGRFPNSQGLLVEAEGTNLVPNPSAEVNTNGFTAAAPDLALSRSTAFSYTGNEVASSASFRISGTGDAGNGRISSGSISISPGANYAASVYVYSESPVQARLELAFTGAEAVAYDTGPVGIAPDQWTRLEIGNGAAYDNTAAEIRLYLVQQRPSFMPMTDVLRFSSPNTAPVTDEALNLGHGDVVLCAVQANPAGPSSYALHVVTTPAIGVSSSQLRLDDAEEAPTFIEGSVLSRLGLPGFAMAGVSDTGLELSAGDLVFCRLLGEDYGWHLVTTGATGVSSTALRLDDAPAAPEFAANSYLTRFTPTSTCLAEDTEVAFGVNDLVFCHPMQNPSASGYGWHVVRAEAAGPQELQLDDPWGPARLASGSRVSRFVADQTAPVSDESMMLDDGDILFCRLNSEGVDAGYDWHMVTSGATGVNSGDLRLDQASAGVLYADAFQLEGGEQPSSYIDSYQGSGFSGSLGASTHRNSVCLSYPTSGIVSVEAGTVAFWVRPLWAGDDGKEHVLFDMATEASRDRMRLSKNVDNRLVLTVYDTDGQIQQRVSDSAVDFDPHTWQHLAFTWSSGTLNLYHNGGPVFCNQVGLGTGTVSTLPVSFLVGSDFEGDVRGGMVVDDLVVKSVAAPESEITAMAMANTAYLGQAPALGGFAPGSGEGRTNLTPGQPVSIPHGLGVRPTFVQLTPLADGVVYLDPRPDETNIHVKSSTSDLHFLWRTFA